VIAPDPRVLNYIDEPDFRERLGDGYRVAEGSRLLAERIERRAFNRAWQRSRLALIVSTGAACALILAVATHA
jgi:hypothetical protein